MKPAYSSDCRVEWQVTMERRIVGYHKDDEDHWVADLECGHAQHVRHQPPMTTRVWVLTEEGRKERIGTVLNCKKCDDGQ